MKILVGDLVNYSYKVRSKSYRGWGKVVGRGKYHGMGHVLHVLPYEQVESIAICLKDKEITKVFGFKR
jgi:hypothetical protein